MPLGLLGMKVGMTQVYNEKGVLCPVTVLQLGPCRVLQVRDEEHDGYDAVQLGFLDKPRRKLNSRRRRVRSSATRPEQGHVSADLRSKRRTKRTEAGVVLPPKPNCEPQRYVREFRLDSPSKLEVGKLLTAQDVFGEIQFVDVIGTSKGRGTAGVMKRHNYAGLRASHGIKKGQRQRGSIASNASNRGGGRPKKGIAMAGRYGNSKVTVRNLDVVRVDSENHILVVKGAVPGPNGGVVIVRPTNKRG